MAVKQESSTTLDVAIKKSIEAGLTDVHTALPGFIVEFDPLTQLATVQVGVKRVPRKDSATQDVTPFAVPPIQLVPVVFQRGGGFCLTFPVKPGDECLLIFSERETVQWKNNGGIATPTETRKHDYTDAIAIVGLASSKNTITNFNPNAVELRSDNGAVSATYTAENITWKAEGVTMILNSTGLNVSGGTFTCDQDITSDTDVKAQTVSLRSHVHISNGAGNPTEPPTV